MVSTAVTEEIAADFIYHKKKKHRNAWVILSLDNLSAYVAVSTKKIFTDRYVLLLYFPSNTTESTQPIDAGYSRSVRCHIINLLDK